MEMKNNESEEDVNFNKLVEVYKEFKRINKNWDNAHKSRFLIDGVTYAIFDLDEYERNQKLDEEKL